MLCLPLRSGFVPLAFMLFSCSLMITVDQMARQLRRFKISYNVGFGSEEATATHSNVLAWKIPGGGGSLVGCSPWSRTGLTSVSRTEEGNGNSSHCSCLENPKDGGAWWAAICGVGHD